MELLLTLCKDFYLVRTNSRIIVLQQYEGHLVRIEDRDTEEKEREKGYVMIEAEIEMIHQRAKECQGFLATSRG